MYIHIYIYVFFIYIYLYTYIYIYGQFSKCSKPPCDKDPKQDHILERTYVETIRVGQINLDQPHVTQTLTPKP